MAQYENSILHNSQFLELTGARLSAHSFLFETQDEVLLDNFSRCFAKFLFCNEQNKPCLKCENCQKADVLSHPDLKIYPKNGKAVLVDDVKDLSEHIYLTPFQSDKKVFIFNNFSSANAHAQNKLLKILEEPPHNSFIILNVSNTGKILPTILSRCRRLRLKPLSEGEMLSAFSDFNISKLRSAIEFAGGSLQKAEMFLKENAFAEIFKNCLSVLMNLSDSRYLLKFSFVFQPVADNLSLILEVFEGLFRDILLFRLNKESLIKNRLHIDEILSVSQDYTADGAGKILKKIYETKQRAASNCSPQALLDSLLLHILEVKYLCKK